MYVEHVPGLVLKRTEYRGPSGSREECHIQQIPVRTAMVFSVVGESNTP